MLSLEGTANMSSVAEDDQQSCALATDSCIVWYYANWSVSPIKSLSTETRNIQFYISQIKPSMIAILGCQFDISGKRESQLRNCFYETGLWACLWSIFFLIAKWSRGLSLHQLAEWFHESQSWSLPTAQWSHSWCKVMIHAFLPLYIDAGDHKSTFF